MELEMDIKRLARRNLGRDDRYKRCTDGECRINYNMKRSFSIGVKSLHSVSVLQEGCCLHPLITV